MTNINQNAFQNNRVKSENKAKPNNQLPSEFTSKKKLPENLQTKDKPSSGSFNPN